MQKYARQYFPRNPGACVIKRLGADRKASLRRSFIRGKGYKRSVWYGMATQAPSQSTLFHDSDYVFHDCDLFESFVVLFVVLMSLVSFTRYLEVNAALESELVSSQEGQEINRDESQLTSSCVSVGWHELKAVKTFLKSRPAKL